MCTIRVAKRLALATAVMLVFTEISVAVSECPDGFSYRSSVNGCYKVLMSNLDWSSAGRQCRALHDDAHLVVIGDAAEQYQVAEFIENHGRTLAVCRQYHGHFRLWIGAQRVKPNSQDATPFVWKVTSADGRRTQTAHMAYTNWIPDNPNFWQKAEHCASVIREFSYQWNDDSCSLQCCAVCEIDLEDFD